MTELRMNSCLTHVLEYPGDESPREQIGNDTACHRQKSNHGPTAISAKVANGEADLVKKCAEHS